jgi:hypothetical protein
MKNLGKLALLGAVLAASASSAFAVSVSTSIWLDTNTALTGPFLSDDPGGALNPALPSGSANYSGTVSNTDPNALFSFSVGLGGSGSVTADVNPNAFLTAGTGVVGGAQNQSVTKSTTTIASSPTDNINNSVWDFTGATYLAAGTYNWYSDDGMYLCINATTSACLGGGSGTTMLINSPGPEGASDHQFTITSAQAGVYDFNLLYTEVDGVPGELEGNLGTLVGTPPPVPEPSSLMLLGTGLMSAAGMLFRRRQQTV